MARWTISASLGGDWFFGVRLRSWALPLLITWTPNLFEIAIGPLFLAREPAEHFPF